eukprot:1220982-Amphidinium_carterae.2
MTFWGFHDESTPGANAPCALQLQLMKSKFVRHSVGAHKSCEPNLSVDPWRHPHVCLCSRSFGPHRCEISQMSFRIARLQTLRGLAQSCSKQCWQDICSWQGLLFDLLFHKDHLLLVKDFKALPSRALDPHKSLNTFVGGPKPTHVHSFVLL